MASRKPVVRQMAGVSIFPQLFVMGILVIIFYLFIKPFPLALFFASIIYLVISFILRRIIIRNHIKGIVLYKKEKYVQAIEEFKKSYEFFCRHSWIDKYRYLTLLSSSRISYTEMALLNIAACYVLMKNATLSKEYYQKALELFPDGEIAKGTLNMIALFEGESEENKVKENISEEIEGNER